MGKDVQSLIIRAFALQVINDRRMSSDINFELLETKIRELAKDELPQMESKVKMLSDKYRISVEIAAECFVADSPFILRIREICL